MPTHTYTHQHACMCPQYLTINSAATNQVSEVEVERPCEVEILLHKEAALLAEVQEGLHGERVHQTHVH